MAHADSPCFPVEIFDLIVDSVQDLEGWQPRLSSLCACSLVSRRFALRARRHIFREATLYAWDDSSNVKMFHEILTWVPSDPETGYSFPPVKSLIKDFSIDYSPSDPEASMLLERVVIAILQVLGGQEGGLESFAFEYEGIWLDLDLGLRQAASAIPVSVIADYAALRSSVAP
ncbi:hypothetical protein NLJ89_g1737 [Agrocybe chaxingu]|uniref:F-box domain-containing protein n=1 Tax=Agrocybe chaxingu TaxID=84603 RepID=A0A9W8TCY2_9AGAR|nr:hypothetical protein NLJ89_g1737 [Agrocybe chaxingu]